MPTIGSGRVQSVREQFFLARPHRVLAVLLQAHYPGHSRFLRQYTAYSCTAAYSKPEIM